MEKCNEQNHTLVSLGGNLKPNCDLGLTDVHFQKDKIAISFLCEDCGKEFWVVFKLDKIKIKN